MRRLYPKIIRNRKQRIERRLRRRNWEEQAEPMLRGGNIHYEMSAKVRGSSYGGTGAFVKLVEKVGLVKEIDARVHVLKRHVPYHESDHVLNVAYNVLLGGERLEDIELRRNDEAYLDGVGAQRIPDPTTAGDFTRRFSEADLWDLMESINTVRGQVWEVGKGKRKGKRFGLAVLDVDGTIARTYGECKEGMGLSYKGIWGYAPLIISLANTKEPLYLVNRPGNAVSHQNAAEWIDRAIALMQPQAKRICLRGDTDFSLTVHLDRWSEKVDFVFGVDAHSALTQRAGALPDKAWKAMQRRARYTVKTEPRDRPANVKERIVKEKGFKNVRLQSEHVAEFRYRSIRRRIAPTKCQRDYRVVALRKNLSIERGEAVLFDDIRYFFYITTRTDLTVVRPVWAEEVVLFANERCDQENVIEQLKNGVNALRMPVDNLLSNWAYMVMASLAWTLKAWFALLMPKKESSEQVLRMEFCQFLHSFILLPCQVLRTGRKIVYRILSYNRWLRDLFATFERIKRLKIPLGCPALS